MPQAPAPAAQQPAAAPAKTDDAKPQAPAPAAKPEAPKAAAKPDGAVKYRNMRPNRLSIRGAIFDAGQSRALTAAEKKNENIVKRVEHAVKIGVLAIDKE
jgi:nucleoid-associated protein YgaU